MSPETNNEETNVELEKISLEIEKLRAETANLKSKIRFVPVITGFVAVLAFCLGLFQFYIQQKTVEEQTKKEYKTKIEFFEREFKSKVDLSNKEFRRKFYEKQLDIYLDLSQTAAQISTLKDQNKIQERYRHFSEIYNGNLIIVNTDTDCGNKVLAAADNFKNAFRDNQTGEPLENSARQLSAALRHSLKCFWEIPIDKTQAE